MRLLHQANQKRNTAMLVAIPSGATTAEPKEPQLFVKS